MKLIFRAMDRETAEEIANWKYEEPYSIYSMDGSQDIVNELLNGEYFAAFDVAGQLKGFVCFGGSAQVPGGYKSRVYQKPAVDIGLGMRPMLTGHGLGSSFFEAVLDYTRSLYPGLPLRLSVASFNLRAIRVYEKSGFKKDRYFYNGGSLSGLEFISMFLDP